MIEWAWPWAFALWVPVGLLLVQPWLTGRNRLAVPSLQAMRGGFGPRVLLAWLPGALRLIGLALVVAALARPQIVRRDTVVESDGLDILLTVDTSGSMETDDFTLGLSRVSRMAAAKGVIDAFIEQRPYDRIGLVVFGQEAFTLVPLTMDHAALRRTLSIVEVGIAGPNATAIGSAVAVASRRMKQIDAAERVVILLTDGRNNVERPDPLQVARAANALGIKLYTIGVGSGGSLFDGGIDEPGLTRLAELTGGRYFRAVDTRTLEQVFETIDALETSPAQVRQLVDREERFRDYLVPGLVLLALHLLLASTWLRRGP